MEKWDVAYSSINNWFSLRSASLNYCQIELKEVMLHSDVLFLFGMIFNFNAIPYPVEVKRIWLITPSTNNNNKLIIRTAWSFHFFMIFVLSPSCWVPKTQSFTQFIVSKLPVTELMTYMYVLQGPLLWISFAFPMPLILLCTLRLHD